MIGQIVADEARYVMQTYKRAPVEFVRGEGALLFDDEGREYIDFLGGISVASVGHCHPEVVAAIREQAGELLHVSNLFYTGPMVELAKRLSESSLGGKVFFCNSGTEANECAIKIARKAARARGTGIRVSSFSKGRLISCHIPASFICSKVVRSSLRAKGEGCPLSRPKLPGVSQSK